MTRKAMRLGLALLLVAACSEKKSGGSADPDPKTDPTTTANQSPSRPAPAGGCDADFADLLTWTAELLEFKADFDSKYLPAPHDVKADLKWHLSGGGIRHVSVDDGRDTASKTAVGYETIAAEVPDPLKAGLVEATGTATLKVDDGVEWSDVVSSVSAMRGLGFSRVVFLIPSKVQIADGPEPSSIRPQLVELANQDDRLMEEKDRDIVAMVFEHCPQVKDNVRVIMGPTRLDRFRDFIDRVRDGMQACGCRADLAEVKESIWVRAMITPFVERKIGFLIKAADGTATEKLEHAAGDDWKTVKDSVLELSALIGEKDPKLVTFSVKN